MSIELGKPLCFIDLETTGVNISKDRIVEICIVKVFPKQAKKVFTWRVNPIIQISKEATHIHGITNEMVKDEPVFKDLAPRIIEILTGSDLCGFNSNKFDIPLLAEELLRVEFEFDFSKIRTLDVQVIFHKKEPRDLAAAYKFYCGKSLKNAHSAEADTLATYEIFMAQMDKYKDLNMQMLSEYSTRNKIADLAGFIGINDLEQKIFNFGKHKGKVVEDVLRDDKGYFNWILQADFPLYTKKVLTNIRLQTLTKL